MYEVLERQNRLFESLADSLEHKNHILNRNISRLINELEKTPWSVLQNGIKGFLNLGKKHSTQYVSYHQQPYYAPCSYPYS